MKKFAAVITILLLSGVLAVLSFRLHPTRSKSELTAKPTQAAKGETDHASSSAPQIQRQDQPLSIAAKVQNALDTPIRLFGKVVDQNGDSVPDANVKFTTIDKFDAKGSDYMLMSSPNGDFSITGIRGAVLIVRVSKSGYREMAGQSDIAFAFGVPPDATRRSPSDGVIEFKLHKAGLIANLFHISSRQMTIPPNGRPIFVNLETGRVGGPTGGQVEVRAQVGDTSSRPFDWNFDVSVPGGGIVARKSAFDFHAPEEGYSASVGEGSSKFEKDGWDSRKNGDFFIRLPDNRYGRLRIRFYGGPRMYVVLESYLNKVPGDRNTESQP